MRKKRTRFSIVTVAVLAILLSSCAGVQRMDSDDPFAAELDNLYAKRNDSANWMLVCGISLVTFAIGGTAVTTLHNMGQMDQGLAVPLIITSYMLSTAAGGVGIYEFVNYNNAFNDYLETLRLQTQYYNTIEWTKHNPAEQLDTFIVACLFCLFSFSVFRLFSLCSI